MGINIDYRPRSFKGFVGSPNVKAAIKGHLERPKHNRTMLITGPSGSGKTTMAQIIATKVKAFDPDKPVEANMNYTYINASDFKGIDTVRSIKDTLHLSPMGACKKKVYHFDECHKLTGDAQEALLAIIETPPLHVYFIFSTTNPESLKDTFKRRCAQFALELVDEETMLQHLVEITNMEGVDVPKTALEQIVDVSTGSIGIALGILESVVGLPPKKMAAYILEEAQKKNAVIDLCRALLDTGKWNKIAAILQGLRGTPPEEIRRAILGYMSNVLLKKDNARAYTALEVFEEPTYNIGFPGIVLACRRMIGD